MKLSKKLGISLAAASLGTSLAYAPLASAEVDLAASAGVANLYLWRGFDVGQGDAAVFGDITASAAGFYGSVWTSSGDAYAGMEYDLIVGYGQEVGDFVFDLALVSYVYPSSHIDPTVNDTEIGDWVEAILTVGYGPLSLSWYETLEAADNSYALGEDYNYYTLGLDLGSFSFLVGHHDYNDDFTDEETHLDVSYAYNDRMSFTLSKMIDDGDGDGAPADDDLLFVLSYTLPIDL
ncbi:TorF family putative porin [Gilvimarinus sp. F26214L]|uniref:TorF family putative porin n=1 Tax=Gilvimarinus sp. DZF01 TaxID=3461371 RepID=UPI00404618E7